MAIRTRFAVQQHGAGAGPALMLAHGFGCDQTMWRSLVPFLSPSHVVVTFDLMGLGRSDLAYYDPQRYASLDAYGEDVLMIRDELDEPQVVFVGHSVSAMIGVLAAARRPEAFAGLVLVGPSPRYLDDDGYEGGFSREDIDGLLESMDANYLGWAAAMSPVIMGNPDRPELADELNQLFCQVDPTIASLFARVTFLSDNRADLAQVVVPTLILQCSDDAIAPTPVGRYVHEHIAGSTFVQLDAIGHCPNLSAPAETAAAIEAFLTATYPSG